MIGIRNVIKLKPLIVDLLLEPLKGAYLVQLSQFQGAQILAGVSNQTLILRFLKDLRRKSYLTMHQTSMPITT